MLESIKYFQRPLCFFAGYQSSLNLHSPATLGLCQFFSCQLNSGQFFFRVHLHTERPCYCFFSSFPALNGASRSSAVFTFRCSFLSSSFPPRILFLPCWCVFLLRLSFSSRLLRSSSASVVQHVKSNPEIASLLCTTLPNTSSSPRFSPLTFFEENHFLFHMLHKWKVSFGVFQLNHVLRTVFYIFHILFPPSLHTILQ